MPHLIRLRSVFFTPLGTTRRIPIAELHVDLLGSIEVRAVAHALGAASTAIDEVRVALADVRAIWRPLPEACGRQASWGELVRVRYGDDSFEDLDERQMVASEGVDRLPPGLPGEPPWGVPPATYLLMDRQINSGASEGVERVYFYAGPSGLPLVPVSQARGAVALIEPHGGGRDWDRVVVETWEEEARRLRSEVDYVARSLRGWAKNERGLAREPPSLAKAAEHEAERLWGSHMLHSAASKIERHILEPATRRPR